jgi:hypothetical protein
MPLTITHGEDRIDSTEGVRAPHLFKLRNGAPLLTFHLDADMHFPRRRCMRSADRGATWRKDTPRNYRELALGESSSGAVLAYDRDTFERCPGTCLGISFVSKDGGATFEGPLETAVHVDRVASQPYPPSPEHYPEERHVQRPFFGPLPDFYKPVVERSSLRRGFGFWRYILEQNGRWLVAMQGRFHGDVCQRSILVESTDEGKTWHFVSTIGYAHDKQIDGLCEPALCRVADGTLLCMLRRHGVAKGNMAQCRSTDNGRTWSAPELQIAHGVDPDLCLLSNGALACTFGRPGCHIVFSEDGCGYSWGYRTELGAWASSAMMGMAEIEPGKLLIVYDKRVGDLPGGGRNPDNCLIGSTTVTVGQFAFWPGTT